MGIVAPPMKRNTLRLNKLRFQGDGKEKDVNNLTSQLSKIATQAVKRKGYSKRDLASKNVIWAAPHSWERIKYVGGVVLVRCYVCAFIGSDSFSFA